MAKFNFFFILKIRFRIKNNGKAIIPEGMIERIANIIKITIAQPPPLLFDLILCSSELRIFPMNLPDVS